MIKITITNFKQNTDHSPFDILIAREDLFPLCLVQAMVEFCKLKDTHASPLLCHSDTSPIPVAELKSSLSFYSLDTCRYKGHSFRIGAASHAADRGFFDAHIRALGRWKSDFKLYIRSDNSSATGYAISLVRPKCYRRLLYTAISK